MALQKPPVAGSGNTTARSYRCSYHPKDLNGHPTAADTGVLPSIRLQAVNAEQAAQLAFITTGCVVSNVERVERVETKVQHAEVA